MIKVIYGDKGSGKTKRLLKMANEAAETAKGDVVFIDDDTRYMYDLKNTTRFIDATEYGIAGPKVFSGFICGLAAQDFDLEYIFVDGFLRLIGHSLDSLADMFKTLDEFTKKRNITLILSVSGSENCIPDFVKQYII